MSAIADHWNRRRVLQGAGAAATLALGACQTAPPAATPLSAPLRIGDPFGLGVASGEPLPDGFVIWTRLAPDPLNGGGMQPERVEVAWEVAEDASFRRIVRRGTATAVPEWAHSVHVEIAGLAADRPYWYRFHALKATSAAGRARTAPPAQAPVREARFAVASCQNFETGLYTPYRHMAQEELDFVLFLGDYIYEYAGRDGRVRKHHGGEVRTLAEYRTRHAQYRADPHLQAAHAAATWMAVPDDHEVQNDYADAQSEKRTDPAEFLRQRAAAYKAYYEHMPLRRASRPVGPAMAIYRRRGWGDLLDLFLLDGRQYRTDQACGGPRWGGQVVALKDCAALRDPARTMLGQAQEGWLAKGLGQRRGRWSVLAQQLLFASLRQTSPGGEEGVWSDGWDGYPLARQRLIDHLVQARVPNPVSLGGDIHSFWAAEIKRDFREARAPAVATDFTGTSISSSGLPQSVIAEVRKYGHPHIKLAEGRHRGYMRMSVTPAQWRAEFRIVNSPSDPEARQRTLASFVVPAGRPGPIADGVAADFTSSDL